MAKKTDSDNDTGIIRQFNELKKKQSGCMLLFRRNSFYELYKQDAVKAATVLAIEIADRMLPDYKRPVKVASFPQSALDVYLPRLIRSGIRVAICDALDSPLKKKAGQDKAENNDRTIQNNTDMGKKKRNRVRRKLLTEQWRALLIVKPAKGKRNRRPKLKPKLRPGRIMRQRPKRRTNRKRRQPRNESPVSRRW